MANNAVTLDTNYAEEINIMRMRTADTAALVTLNGLNLSDTFLKLPFNIASTTVRLANVVANGIIITESHMFLSFANDIHNIDVVRIAVEEASRPFRREIACLEDDGGMDNDSARAQLC